MNTHYPLSGWANKGGTATRACSCQTWKQHWINFADQRWPAQCAVAACPNAPTLGAHVYHPDVSGEQIVPMCARCNMRTDKFSLKPGVCVVSANRSETCDARS